MSLLRNRCLILNGGLMAGFVYKGKLIKGARKLILLSLCLPFLFVSCRSREGLLEKPRIGNVVQTDDSSQSASHNSPLEQVDYSTLRGFYEDVEDPPFSYQAKDGENVLYIKQNLFNMQIADIYYAFKRYADRKIVIQGMYARLTIGDNPDVPTVYRRGTGCCGNDGWGGFLLELPDDGSIEEPERDAWIEVVGTPELKTHGLYYNLYLKVESIKVLDERGAEYVRS